ncbi:MAG: hypothetical protein H6819_08610 [Phycisphaerales bacterium]|nr:hypothetical protein [Phycisphaerales bacterium]MCB9855708.1 hypothetical protein [Phycisphaerales bacterium]MCB9862603.1 hypothetical protein [Phycisphaerales bacterium]
MAIIRRVESRAKRITLWVMGLLIIVPGAYGFAEKMRQFILTLNTEEGAGFTIIPIANYFLIAGGMACLFGWAMCNGMFGNVEEPKYTMLDHERELDEQDGVDWSKQ